MKSERHWTAANVVTGARIAFLPVLWAWALDGRVTWLGLGVMASFLADIVDGQLARRLDQETQLGSRLDSIGDFLLEVSCVFWLPAFRPEILQQPYVTVVGLAIASWALIIVVGLVRFRRFLNLHLYSGKASGVAGSLFVMDAFVFGFHAPLFYLAFGVFTLANLEGTLLMLTRSHVDEHAGSIFKARPTRLAA